LRQLESSEFKILLTVCANDA